MGDAGAGVRRRLFTDGCAVTEAVKSEIREQLLKLAEDATRGQPGRPRAGRRQGQCQGQRRAVRDDRDTRRDGTRRPAPPRPWLRDTSAGPRERNPELRRTVGYGVICGPDLPRTPFTSRSIARPGSRESWPSWLRTSSGKIVNKRGRQRGRCTGGVVMGLGQALTEGIQIAENGTARNAYLLDYKLPDRCGRPPLSTVALHRRRRPVGWSEGLEGHRRAAHRPDPRAVANAIALASGVRIRQLPATPYRVWSALRGRRPDERVVHLRDLGGGGRLAALSNGGRIVAGGTDLVVGTRQGKGTIPQDLVAIDRIAETPRNRATADGGAVDRRPRHAPGGRGSPGDPREVHRARGRILGSWGSPATRQRGRSVATWSTRHQPPRPPTPHRGGAVGGPGPLATGERRVPVADVATGPGRDGRPVPRAPTPIELPALPRGTVGSCYARLEYRRQMEIAVVGATASGVRIRTDRRRPS